MSINRYHRQELVIGGEAQGKLARARVLLVGCGALGTTVADQLVRSGVGFLRIVDRDLVDETNLQRQVLFDEEDARQGMPKALAAVNKLAKVNSTVDLEPVVADVHSGNVERVAGHGARVTGHGEDAENGRGLEAGATGGFDVIVDATDNAGTRYLINDFAVKHGVPWVYGAALGREGRVATFTPVGPCLRCVFANSPAPGELATCDTAGVLGALTNTIGSLQALAAIKLLVGEPDEDLLAVDIWNHDFRKLSLRDEKREDCPCCGAGSFEFLSQPAPAVMSLCGNKAIQIQGKQNIDVKVVSSRFSGAICNRFFTRICRDGITLTLFPDGRAIIQGADNVERARAIYDQLVGS